MKNKNALFDEIPIESDSDLDFPEYDFSPPLFIGRVIPPKNTIRKSNIYYEADGLANALMLAKAGAYDEERKSREKALEEHLGIKPSVSEKEIIAELELPKHGINTDKKESVSKVKASRDTKNMSCMEFMALYDTDEDEEEEEDVWITPKGIDRNDTSTVVEVSSDNINSVEVSSDNVNLEMIRLVKETIRTERKYWKTETFVFNKICMPDIDKEKRRLILWQKIDHDTFSDTLCFDFDGLRPDEFIEKTKANPIFDSVLAVMESSKGNTHVLVKVQNNLLNENNFKKVYKTIGEELDSKLNSKYDTACNDLVRGFLCPNRIVFFNKNCADFDLKNFIKTNTACMLIGDEKNLVKNAVFDSVEAVSDPRVEVSLILLHEKNDTSTFDKDVDKNYNYKNERVEVSSDNSNSKRVEVSSDNSNSKPKKPKGEFVKGNRNNFLIKTISEANLNGDIDKLEEILYPYINHKNNNDKKYTKEVIDKKIDWARKTFNPKFRKKSVFKETPKKSYEAYRELRINGKTHITAWTFTDSTISIATQKRWRAKYNKEFGIKAKYGVKGRKCKKQNLENKHF